MLLFLWGSQETGQYISYGRVSKKTYCAAISSAPFSLHYRGYKAGNLVFAFQIDPSGPCHSAAKQGNFAQGHGQIFDEEGTLYFTSTKSEVRSTKGIS